MNISLELYRVFYIVAKTSNITKASIILHISQPAVTKTIKNLEELLKLKLFIRTQKGVTLTNEGELIYVDIKRAMEIIDITEQKIEAIKNLNYGLVRIGIGSTLTREFLLPYLKVFHKLYPQIKIDIVKNEYTYLIESLQMGKIDFVIANLPIKEYSNLNIIRCLDVHDVFICNNDYPQLINRKVSLQELTNYPLILQSTSSNTRKYLDNFLYNNQIILTPSMELDSYSLVVDFSKIGLGVGYATKEYIQSEIKNKELFVIDIIPEIPKRNIGLILLKNNELSASTNKFIDIILNKNN